LTKGDDCVVVFVPVVASCPGRRVLPISLPRAVTGIETESGDAARGARGFVAGAAAGVTAGAAGAAGGVVARAIAAEVALSTFCTVDWTAFDGVAAPAGVKPAIAPAAMTSPHATAPMPVEGFRLMVLLLLCWVNTAPL
jgi:hypothetical protein